MTPLAYALSWPVRAYRLLLSPWLGHHCRYLPTCSAYALEALETHGGLHGGFLALRRLARCNPWGGCGHDPVPPSRGRRGIAAPPRPPGARRQQP